MKVRRGDVVIADFPYSDRAGSKIRPTLVVGTDANNTILDDAILAAVSRSTRGGAFTHVLIAPTTPDGQSAGLLHRSFVQCENLFTLDQQLIIRILGHLSPALLQQVDKCLKAAQDWPRPRVRSEATIHTVPLSAR